MKNFKQNYQIQVQIRLVRNYEIQIQSKSIKKLQIRSIYIQNHVHLCYPACRVDIRQDSEFATGSHIQKLLSNGNWKRIRISETLLSIFRGFRLLWKKLPIAQSFINYLQKHLFKLLCHYTESVMFTGIPCRFSRQSWGFLPMLRFDLDVWSHLHGNCAVRAKFCLFSLKM